MSAVEVLFSSLGGIVIALVAVVLSYLAIRSNINLEKRRLDFQEKRYEAEKREAEELVKLRRQEEKRIYPLAFELAEQISRRLIDDPHWASSALEEAKFLPYKDTLFGERSQHFKEEKEELARLFAPCLMKRCRYIIETLDRDVYLLVDAGTTLYPFFSIIGRETVKAWQLQEHWLKKFHLATNNLPGIEQLIRTGRRTRYDRYSGLAIEDCQLLPGIPLPIFAAVAGDRTNEAIINLRKRATENGGKQSPVVIALVVGNWVRIRRTPPSCPVPMARGDKHLRVKDTLIHNADEIFVVSPLGKIFVKQSNADVNQALGFDPAAQDPEKNPYDEVSIDDDLARRVKLISTRRRPGRILHRHSNRVEDELEGCFVKRLDEDTFEKSTIEELPHCLVLFDQLPEDEYSQFVVEFPHRHTRAKPEFLEMFCVQFPE